MFSISFVVNPTPALEKLKTIRLGVFKALIIAAGDLKQLATARCRAYGGKQLWSRIARSLFITQTPNRVIFGTDDPVAIHKQLGGVIRARSAKFLTIPLPGVTGAARHKKLILVRSKLGNFVLINKKGYPEFVLKREVYQRAFPFMPTGQEARAFFEDRIREFLPR